MTVYINAGPVIGAVVTVGVAAVGGLAAHSRRREKRQSGALDKVATSITLEVNKWADAVLGLMSALSDVKADVAYLKGVRSGEESAARKAPPRAD